MHHVNVVNLCVRIITASVNKFVLQRQTQGKILTSHSTMTFQLYCPLQTAYKISTRTRQASSILYEIHTRLKRLRHSNIYPAILQQDVSSLRLGLRRLPQSPSVRRPVRICRPGDGRARLQIARSSPTRIQFVLGPLQRGPQT